MSHIKQFFGPSLLVLLAIIALSPIARAETQTDPARSQTAAGYTITFVSPDEAANHDTDKLLTFRFEVKDGKGGPVSGLNLTLTALRDYSGQVANEHNGPRVPNIGPLTLTPAAQPGQYEANIRFGINGHWFLQLGGPSLGSETVKFRTPIGASDDKGAGFNLDWLLWPGILVTVLTIVALTWRKGTVFPTPTEELEPPVPATDPTLDEKAYRYRPDPGNQKLVFSGQRLNGNNG